MFILSCVGCFYNLFLCFYVYITTTKLSSHFMRHPIQVIMASSIDVALSVVLVILAFSSPAVWEHGGTVAQLRVSNMTVQVLLATVCYALALSFYYWSFGEVEGLGEISPFKRVSREQ